MFAIPFLINSLLKEYNFRDKRYGWKVFNLSVQFIIDTKMENNSSIITINFRNKEVGWKKYTFTINDKNGNKKSFSSSENIFMNGFLQNLYLRPSCYQCPSKLLKSGSDITIADYWGVQTILPGFDDDKGVSLVMINTVKGKMIYDQLEKDDRETTYTNAVIVNTKIEKSAIMPAKRTLFFKKWKNGKLSPLINKLTKRSMGRKIIILVLKKIGLYAFIKAMIKEKK
jgi:hypothetical protein